MSIVGEPVLMGWVLDSMLEERHICHSAGLYYSDQLDVSIVHSETLTAPAIECSKEPLYSSLGCHCGSVERSPLVSTSVRTGQKSVSAESSIMHLRTA